MKVKRLMGMLAAVLPSVMVVAFASLTATPAFAGVEMATEIIDLAGGGANAPRQARMIADKDQLRMDRAQGRVLIFRGDRNLAWTIDTHTSTYVEIDRGTMQQMRGQVDAARGQVTAELDKLPPEQRAQVEKMTGGAATGGAAPAAVPTREAPRVIPSGKTDTVGGISCREVEVTRGKEKESEICVADWAAAGIAKADLEGFRKLVAFQEEMTRGIGISSESADGEQALALYEQLDGVPVRVRTFKGGAPRTEMRILKIEKKALDPALFEVPAGYTKRTMPGSAALGAPRARPPVPSAR